MDMFECITLLFSFTELTHQKARELIVTLLSDCPLRNELTVEWVWAPAGWECSNAVDAVDKLHLIHTQWLEQAASGRDVHILTIGLGR